MENYSRLPHGLILYEFAKDATFFTEELLMDQKENGSAKDVEVVELISSNDEEEDIKELVKKRQGIVEDLVKDEEISSTSPKEIPDSQSNEVVESDEEISSTTAECEKS